MQSTDNTLDNIKFNISLTPFTKTENSEEENCLFLEAFKKQEKYISVKWEHYFPVYDRYLKHFVREGKPINLLEIGVQNGGSLETWKKYLPENSQINGIDVDAKCANLNFSENINFYLGNATDSAFIAKNFTSSQFDVIIDDGSHYSSDIMASFTLLFSKLKMGGIYIIEDCHACYWNCYNGGFRYAGSAIEFFKNLVDALNLKYVSDEKLASLDTTRARLKSLNQVIASISFYDSMIIIEKYLTKREEPFRVYYSHGEGKVVSASTTENIALPCDTDTPVEKIYTTL